MIHTLKPGDRCGVIMPEGVQFGSAGAHKPSATLPSDLDFGAKLYDLVGRDCSGAFRGLSSGHL
jgi:hypothetical protein